MAFITLPPLWELSFIHCPSVLVTLSSLSGSLSLSYLLGRRRWRSPWPSWQEPWAGPAEWGRSSPPPPARSGTSGSETHTLKAQRQKEKKRKNLWDESSRCEEREDWRERFRWCETEKNQQRQRGRKTKRRIWSDGGEENEWRDLGRGSNTSILHT